ncbi:MAG: NAD(P)-dependent oxidoreductase [Candidatus Margulisbacteria bacterium]|nr:NAD(P)-dependent oxidoreductase [Candidatus Margulisiibacteriota bacterium]
MKKIFVTGGSGFIGRNIIEQLNSSYELLAPGHAELELLDEAAVKNYLGKNKPDVVVHCAVRPGHRNARDASHQLDHNCRLFFNLARNSDLFGRLIYLSSGAVYDQRYYRPKMKEEYFDAHVPIDEVGFSKYIAAKYIEQTKNITELRLFGIFGRYEDYAIRFISNMICKTLFDLPLTIKQDRRFDYVHVDDLRPVLEHFIDDGGRHKAYNITPDSSIELLALAEKVKTIAGRDLPIKIAQPGLGVEYSGDNSRLRSEMKSLTLTPIDAAIRKLWGWYSDNIASLDRECLLYDK